MSSKIQTADTATAAESLQQALEELPGPISNALAQYIGTPEQIVSGIQGSLDSSAEAVASTVVRSVIRPVAVALLRFLVFFVLFILLMIVVGLVARLVNGLFKAPVLKQVNGALGAVIGLIQGFCPLRRGDGGAAGDSIRIRGRRPFRQGCGGFDSRRLCRRSQPHYERPRVGDEIPARHAGFKIEKPAHPGRIRGSRW